MIRICILGDSHVACLKHGWDIIKDDYDQVSITFFAKPDAKSGISIVDGLKVKGKYLIPDNDSLKKTIAFTSGCLEYVDIDSYDHYLIFGLRLVIYKNFIYYSTQVREQALRDHIFDCRAWRLLQKVRSITDKPIYLGHSPLGASLTSSEDKSGLESYHNIVTWVNTVLLKKHNVIMPVQPAETIVNGFETMLKYSKAVATFWPGETTPDSDCMHMNDEFGAIYLSEFLNRL